VTTATRSRSTIAAADDRVNFHRLLDALPFDVLVPSEWACLRE
jgi:hypothetical protein